eukprot:TRINITY_DN7095_c0_g2_i3.p1 TRINITY_DN7095_c0_g2~~TRINITY_DN7095_c0_g2_i3.p1  ORF type:complete len:528 (+),score=55.69 TRINITY_DN7095_c0_g2_i3:75-1586(+)
MTDSWSQFNSRFSSSILLPHQPHHPPPANMSMSMSDTSTSNVRRSKRLSDEGLPAGMKRVALGDITNKASDAPRRSERLLKTTTSTTVAPKTKESAAVSAGFRHPLVVPSFSNDTQSSLASSNPFAFASSFTSIPSNNSNPTYKFNIQPSSFTSSSSLLGQSPDIVSFPFSEPTIDSSRHTGNSSSSSSSLHNAPQHQHQRQPSQQVAGRQPNSRSTPVSYIDIDAVDPGRPGESVTSDPQLCSVYAEDIFEYLRASELKHQPTRARDYMKIQTDITPHMRMILVDWLVEVADEYKLSTETLYLGINYLDRYLTGRPISRGNLQLVGVACMLIASKYEEIYPPSVEDFVYIADNTYSREQVMQMESQVLDQLGFVLTVATPKVFLRRFQRAAAADATATYLSNYICELALTEYRMNQYLPSTVAAASVFLTQHTMHRPAWTPTLEHYTRLRSSDHTFQQCVRELYQLHRNPTRDTAHAIFDKYSSEAYQWIAKVSRPASSLPF